MAPAQSKITKPVKAQFFAPRPRRNITTQDYANIERNEVTPHNPPRVSTTSTASYTYTASNSLDGDGDTINAILMT